MTDFSQVSHEDTVGEDNSPVPLDPPQKVAGRVLHIDADFLCYQCGFRYEEESVAASIKNLEVRIETLRIMAGAEKVQLHITLGDKGGRDKIARVKQYQEQRSEKPEGLKERVLELRLYMAERNDCSAWYDQEADDGLAQAMWLARTTGQPHLAVLWSLDKDLNMVGGLRMDGESYELVEKPWAYGWTEYDKDKKKLTGCGTSFFFHQLLAGDTVDNIPGLPTLTRDMVLKYLPLPKYYTNAQARVAKTNAQKLAKAKAIRNAEDKIKAKPCGVATAVTVLEDCKTEIQAAQRCYELYAALYGRSHTFTAWDQKQETKTSGDMLLEQGRLLWMRRTAGEDVLDFFKEIAQ